MSGLISLVAVELANASDATAHAFRGLAAHLSPPLPSKQQFLAALEQSISKCAICHDDFEDLVELPCKHKFCHRHIVQWLKANDTCPCCRTGLFRSIAHNHAVMQRMDADWEMRRYAAMYVLVSLLCGSILCAIGKILDQWEDIGLVQWPLLWILATQIVSPFLGNTIHGEEIPYRFSNSLATMRQAVTLLLLIVASTLNSVLFLSVIPQAWRTKVLGRYSLYTTLSLCSIFRVPPSPCMGFWAGLVLGGIGVGLIVKNSVRTALRWRLEVKVSRA